ncbi:bromodomain adjacent to zinc finger domain protein 1A-like [Oppia nitens]|uniref:bromodomain adjacent to zinc finger domain protein 1A-like n=1 Tax=Oppia nitens TaxID=1686743 RepID=UPI0023DC3799|nr:bromodomain adjacent to zinc finger domain protein 1A-like [Oppia nitens]
MMEIEMKSDSKEDSNGVPDGTSLLVNQTISVTQKRQKKSSAPIPQRIRPISKRKKFKKSLGPDFLETAELGMAYLRDTYEPKCDICSLTMFSSSTSFNVLEELLHCNNCDAKAHPSCVNVNEEVVHKTQWQCHNCKLCSVCHQNDTNEYVIICMTCSKGFHVRCHSTQIINKPKGNWYCNNCCSKGSVHLLVSNGVSDKKSVCEQSDESDEEETENIVEPKEEKCFDFVNQNDDNYVNDNEKISSDDSRDSLKEQMNRQQNNENIDELIENNKLNDINEDNDKQDDKVMDTDSISNAESSSNTNLSPKPAISPQKWTVEEVETFIRDSGFPSESLIFKEQEIDGRSLLLLRRMDVLTGLSLKLGPALKIYNHISRLQGLETSQQLNNC